ncbi:MAG: DUF3987 domain-containing protein [Planctomycetota bacterium]
MDDSTPAPSGQGLRPDAIPHVLKNRAQWVLWRTVTRDGKSTKVPFQANGQEAKSNDPSTWCSFDVVWARLQKGGFDGVGYVFSHYDDFVGLDFDACRNPETGEIATWAREAITRLDSYSEVSPSETGVKVFARGKSPFSTGKKQTVDGPAINGKEPGIEIYSHGRYFALTGWRLSGMPPEPQERDLQWIRQQFWPTPRTTNRTPPPSSTPLIERARKYVAKMPPAISGQGGHDRTFAAACALVLGFELDEEAALGLLREYNTRCEPPWSESELVHKIKSAAEQPGERGYLRDAEEPANNSRPSRPPTSGGGQKPRRRYDPPPPWQPFPVDVLPEPIRGYCQAGAHAMKIDPTYIVVPMLAGLAGAIGATRQVRLKSSWSEPCVIWSAVVGESGTLKSPAQSFALAPLRRAQEWQLEQLPQLQADFLRDKQLYEADYQEWKRKGRSKGEPPPEKPEEPQVDRYMVSDITIEALAEILSSNPRGVLAGCDELGSWLGAFDQYRSGRGTDVPKWLSIHRAEGLIVDRKTGTKKTIFVKRAAVSVSGSIQPGALSRALGGKGGEYFDNGLAARLLLASPPRVGKRWSDAGVDIDTYKAVERVYARLLALNFGTDENDEPVPVDVPLSPEGKALWIEFYNEHAVVTENLTGKMAAAAAKIEGYAARLALVLHLAKITATDDWAVASEVIDAESMAAGISLARWFVSETDRVYRILEESDTDTEQRQLVEFIERRGGRITANDLQRRSRKIADIREADSFLQGLVDAGIGCWVDVPPTAQGGRPTRAFQIRAGVSVS